MTFKAGDRVVTYNRTDSRPLRQGVIDAVLASGKIKVFGNLYTKTGGPYRGAVTPIRLETEDDRQYFAAKASKDAESRARLDADKKKRADLNARLPEGVSLTTGNALDTWGVDGLTDAQLEAVIVALGGAK